MIASLLLPADELEASRARHIRPAPATLPADRAAGRGELIYVVAGTAFLVTDTGAQYRLPGATTDSSSTTLSPNGRWLLHDGKLRDLASTEVRTLDASTAPLAWSPDARWLISRSGIFQPEVPRASQQILDVATGNLIELDLHGLRSATGRSLEALAVLDDGSVLMTEARGEDAVVTDSRRTILIIVDPTTGSTLRQVLVDTTQVLRGEEAINGGRGLIAAILGPQNQVLMRVGGDPGSRAIGVVASLTDGAVTGRINGPPDGTWDAMGFTGQGVLMKRIDGMANEVVAWDGAPRILYTHPSDATVLVPGAMTFA